MTRVDFYILSTDESSRDRFACALSGKAVAQGHQVYIQTGSRESAQLLDDLLWTFRDISFIPHALADDNGGEGVPVHIGWDGDSADSGDVIINLGNDIPAHAGAFSRVMEIVVTDAASRQQSRDRYRRYRELGFEMHSHELESDHANL